MCLCVLLARSKISSVESITYFCLSNYHFLFLLCQNVFLQEALWKYNYKLFPQMTHLSHLRYHKLPNDAGRNSLLRLVLLVRRKHAIDSVWRRRKKERFSVWLFLTSACQEREDNNITTVKNRGEGFPTQHLSRRTEKNATPCLLLCFFNKSFYSIASPLACITFSFVDS